MTNKIVFANSIQRALWINELSGQISDGYWENARPNDHWVEWCRAEATVAKDGEPTGRNFSVIKDNYNLASSFLLECVGDRMLTYAALGQAFSEFTGQFPESASDFDRFQEWATTKPWAASRVAEWEAAGITREAIVESTGKITMEEMKKELTAMKKIIKSRIA